MKTAISEVPANSLWLALLAASSAYIENCVNNEGR
jgi:hypothetical protein